MAKEYIEREALFNYPMRRDNYDTKNGNIHFINGIESILEYAESLPPADVQELRHGKWEEQLDGTHYCSHCGRDATYTFDGNEVCGIVCTYCGAKMDKT